MTAAPCSRAYRGWSVCKSHTKAFPSRPPDAASGSVPHSPTASTPSAWPWSLAATLRLARFTRHTRPSAPPVRTRFESGWQSRAVSICSWNSKSPSKVCVHWAVRGSHHFSVPSADPVTRLFPSGRNAPHVTGPPWPPNICMYVPELALHIQVV